MLEFARTPLKGIDRERLSAVVEPIVHAHGAEVVDIEFKGDRSGWVLRLYVEKAGSAEHRLSTQQAAVNLELCADIARELSPALDVADLVPHAYNLEVSSPGVERVLRGEADLVRFAGQKARVKLHAPVEGQKVLVGVLGPLVTDAPKGAAAPCEGSPGAAPASPRALTLTLTVAEGRKTHLLPLREIPSAQLVFEFGPAPKPGKPGAHASHGSRAPKVKPATGSKT